MNISEKLWIELLVVVYLLNTSSMYLFMGLAYSDGLQVIQFIQSLFVRQFLWRCIFLKQGDTFLYPIILISRKLIAVLNFQCTLNQKVDSLEREFYKKNPQDLTKPIENRLLQQISASIIILQQIKRHR